MTGLAERAARLLAAGEPAMLVSVAEALGSAPRDAGAGMLVTRDAIHGTVGGGQLEWQAMARARELLETGGRHERLELPLGPAVGQCCGGHVVLDLAPVDGALVDRLRAAETAERDAQPQVLVFGAGHVGSALVAALAPLPVRVVWSDARPDAFPAATGTGIAIDRGDPLDVLASAEAGAAALTMTHSHPLDYAITEAGLLRGDLGYVGMIGSRTKRRRFERWFTARGGDARALGGLVCPIGGSDVDDKRPAVIAALAAAEIVTRLWRARAAVQDRAS